MISRPSLRMRVATAFAATTTVALVVPRVVPSAPFT